MPLTCPNALIIKNMFMNKIGLHKGKRKGSVDRRTQGKEAGRGE